mmetsp:Transcript_54077/g.143979  ORF Transcript_54077/g.143979 Transcript_54077/m.143979 type:complete len:303 (+) Transcript_54077:56-964(+)
MTELHPSTHAVHSDSNHAHERPVGSKPAWAWYSGEAKYDAVLTVALVVGALSLSATRYQGRAPYGKFGGAKSAGVALSPQLGWLLMELPAPVMFLIGLRNGWLARAKEDTKPHPTATKMLSTIFLLHYLNRTLVFPLLIRSPPDSKATFALMNSATGAIIVGAHGWLHGRLFSKNGKHLTREWLSGAQFKLGVMVYELGFALLLHSEHVLRCLRPRGGVVSGENRYKIPFGGGFTWISSPQYLGELMAWAGLRMCTGSPATWFVLMISLANLVPRSFEQHKWYLRKFPDYPRERRALLPFLC